MKPEEVLEALGLGKEFKYNYLGGYWVINNPAWVINNPALPVDVLTSEEYSLRIKEMIATGNVSFPKPETKKPNMNSKYYTPLLGDTSEAYIELIWEDDPIDNISLTEGSVHLSKDNAIAHAKALIKYLNRVEEYIPQLQDIALAIEAECPVGKYHGVNTL